MTLSPTSCASEQKEIVTSTPTLPTPTPTKLPPPEDWQFRWLKGVPCRAPCWEGITPGKTSATEAIEILKQSPLVAYVQQGRYAPSSGLGDVSWDWINGDKGGYANYPINTSAQIIGSIFPAFRQRYALRDVLQAYGEPSHILAQAKQGPDIGSGIFYDVWLVYLPQGLALTGGGATKPDLENMYLDRVIFYIPTREGLEANVWLAKEHPEWVLPWQGFKGFDYYCRDETHGIECRGK